MRPGFLFVLPFLLWAGFAHADTISSFNLTGQSLFYGFPGHDTTVSGSMTVDVTSGVIESISFTAGGVYESGVDSQSGPIVFVGVDDAKMSFDAGSMIDYAGSAWDLNGPNDLYVGHGTMAVMTPPPPAITGAPEPASIFLLGTGLCGVTALLRRRSVRVA